MIDLLEIRKSLIVLHSPITRRTQTVVSPLIDELFGAGPAPEDRVGDHVCPCEGCAKIYTDSARRREELLGVH